MSRLAASPVSKALTVDVVSDVVCPWCWIGKRNLEEALSRLPPEQRSQVEVRWHPFQLRPDTPLSGTAKEPSTPDNPRVGARLRAAGQAVGIDFTGKTDRTPNTLASHTLLQYAGEHEGFAKQNELQEILFRKYFTDGIFPDSQSLATAAEEAGLDVQEAMAYAEDPVNQALVSQEAISASASGVNSVPYFKFNGAPAFSGAQPPELFLKVIAHAMARTEKA